MPAALAPTTEAPVTGKSFADLIPDLVGMPPDNSAPDDSTAADDAAPTPDDEAPPLKKDEPKKEEPAAKTDAVDPALNPHLDEPEPVKVEKKDTATDDEVPKGMTAKATDTWKTLKQSEKAAVAERDAIKAELATAKKQIEDAGKTGPEIERLKAEKDEIAARLAEYEGEIAVTRVEATPHYKAQVSAPIKSSEETTRALATKYEVGAAALLDAIREPDAEKRADLLSELSADFKGYDAKRLFDAADAHAAATKAGEDMRTNASTKLEQLTKEQQRETEQIATANLSDYRTSADAEWKALQERHPMLRPVEGKPEWNAYLEGIRTEIASVNINDLPVSEVAQMRAQARVLPEIVKALTHFQKQAKDERDKRVAAETRLGEYRQTEPGAGTGSTTQQREEGSVSRFADIPGFN